MHTLVEKTESDKESVIREAGLQQVAQSWPFADYSVMDELDWIIRSTIVDGAFTPSYLAKKTGLPRKAIDLALTAFNYDFQHPDCVLEIPVSGHGTRKANLERLQPTYRQARALVQAGASPTKIAQAVSLKKLSTPERILGHRYLRLTEQVDEHQAARRRFLELKQNREEPVERMLAHIGSLLGDYAVSRLKQLGNPSKGYALSYRLRSRNGGLSLPELETRFAEYFCAAQEESLPAIDELAERIGVSQTTLSAFLRKGHLTTLKRPNFHRSSSHLASSRSEEITKAYDLGMTAGDASHFLDLPHHSVIKEYKKLQMDNRPKKSRHPFLKILASQEKLTYAKASKIYEASDLGFEPHEVAELVEASPEMVEHAQSERQNIGDQITFYLSSMVGKEFKQPYPSAEPSQ